MDEFSAQPQCDCNRRNIDIEPIVFYFKGPGRNNRDPDTLELDETDEDVATLAMLASQDLLNMYILKLEEEANYFKSSSPEDEICSCKNCQVLPDSLLTFFHAIFVSSRELS